MISNKELNILIKKCKTKLDFRRLITSLVNEVYGRITDKQLLKVLKLLSEKGE